MGTGSVRQAGRRKPSRAGREGRQRRGRGKNRWKFRVKVPDSPAGWIWGDLGTSLPSEPLGARALKVPWSAWPHPPSWGGMVEEDI